jgi:hypothetical protein
MITETRLTKEKTDFLKKKAGKVGQEFKKKRTFHMRYQRNQFKNHNLDRILAKVDLTKSMT